MWNFRINLLLFANFVLIFETVNSTCTISLRDKFPLFTKSFGSKKIALPQQSSEVKLETGEAVQAYCSSGINLRQNYKQYIESSHGINSIETFCNGTEISFVKIGFDHAVEHIDHNVISISCDSVAQQLYESKKVLPNCENYLSYAIGTAPTELDHIVSAGICYDLDKLSVKYVNYLAYRPKYTISDTKDNTNSTLGVSLDMKLNGFNNLFYFLSTETFKKNFELKKITNTLLQLQKFDYESLIQDRTTQAELKTYENMFKIVWWHNLRMGNWLYFQMALEKQTEHTTFTIFTGTSGTLTMPSIECTRQEIFTLESMGITVNAPAYIWSYIKSPVEEFVVVGYNTPYLLLKNTTLSCKDICHEIDWLAKSLFGRTHLMPNLGLVHCCRVENIADKLDNFPLKFVKPKPKTAATMTTMKKQQSKDEAKPKHIESSTMSPLDMTL